MIRLYARGIHHESIFSYNIPSHVLMNDIIRKVFDSIRDLAEVAFYGCEDSEELYEIDKETCLELSREELLKIQDAMLERAERLLNEIALKINSEVSNMILKVRNACDEDDACFIDVFLFYVKDGYIQHILFTSFDFSIHEADNVVYIDPTIRTAIFVPESPLPAGLIDKLADRISWAPDNPEREEAWEMEL